MASLPQSLISYKVLCFNLSAFKCSSLETRQTFYIYKLWAHWDSTCGNFVVSSSEWSVL